MKHEVARKLGLAGLLALATTGAVAQREDGLSTPGALIVRLEDGSARELPLAHTDVRVEISAFVARTVVEQTFRNPLSDPVEAVYAFPLGHEAAVDDFELQAGDQVIRGEIHRREQARQIYEEAREQGYQAALLEQERPNVFIQSIANLMPAAEIRVRIRTVELLDYRDGTYEYLFPTVVGPRYGESEALAAAISYAPAAVRGEAPDERDGDDLTIHVELEAGVPIRDLRSPTQTVYVSERNGTAASVELAECDRIPNRDFILRWDVSSREPAVGLLAHRSDGDGTFALLVQPRGTVEPDEAAPKEVVLVLDTSGSMGGTPLEMSKAFVEQALLTLGPRDRFNLIRFASGSDTFESRSVPNEPEHVRRALRWIENLDAGGGTEMLAGLQRAIEAEVEPGTYRQIVFLTDGLIGTEPEMVGAIAKLPEAFRVFTVGIGGNVNHSLLDRMAAAGRGAFTYIPDDAERWTALERFRAWVTRPYLTDLEIDWGALPITGVVPERPPDLFSGQNLYVVGRYVAAAQGTVTLRGRLAGRLWEQQVEVRLPEHETANAALGSVWARHRIEELTMTDPEGLDDAVREQVTELALEHRLMTAYTSFVAVDYSHAASSDRSPRRVIQKVPLPDGVEVPAGESFERVMAVASSALVDLQSTQSATVFHDEFVQDLPVPGRFYQNVLSLAPGVSDGSRTRDFTTIVGSTPALDTSGLHSASIGEMQVVSAGAGVEFGRAQGGFARIVQKQGSNDLEGRVELLYSSHRLDGDPAGGSYGGAVPGFGAYEASATIAGPIVRDRLWFRATHAWADRDDPVDTLRSVEVEIAETVVHADQLTWQASPRHKLSLERRDSTRREGNVGVGSWRGPDATARATVGGPVWSLDWAHPISPRALIVTALVRQELSLDVGPNEPGAANTCAGAADGWLAAAQCQDWIDHGTSGASSLELSDTRVRESLSTKLTLYVGPWLGSSHELDVGATLGRERHHRRLTRGPALFRMEDAGQERLLASFAPDPHDASRATGAGWSVWVEDRLKPTASLVLTVGLRADGIRLEGPNEVRIDDTPLSPFLGVSWDPRARGRTKLFATFGRRHGDLPPALALAEQEPATVALADPDPQAPLPAGPRNVQLLDPELRAPRQDEWTAGIEQEVATEMRLAVTWIERRYADQLGHVDANHDGPVEPGDWPAVDPTMGEVLIVRNSRTARYRALVVSLVRRLYRSFELQSDYTWSTFQGDGEPFVALAGLERTRIEDGPGRESNDEHRASIHATTLRGPYRLGGTLRWSSGLPFSDVEPGLLVSDGGVAVPRLFLDGERNSSTNESVWTADLKLTREWSVSGGVTIGASIEVFDLFDDDTPIVWTDGIERGLVIDGAPDATRRYGRRFQLGLSVQF